MLHDSMLIYHQLDGSTLHCTLSINRSLEMLPLEITNVRAAALIPPAARRAIPLQLDGILPRDSGHWILDCF